jgi:competence protein ComFC
MSLVDVIFPKTCLRCGRSGKYICLTCIRKVRPAKGICIICERQAVDGMTHIKCLKKQSLNGAVSLWNYEGVVRRAIIGLKYKYAFKIAEELSGWTGQILKQKFTTFSDSCVLVPIPLHRRRENWRGFNQATELGKLIAREMGWKFIPDVLIRKKQTQPQTILKERQRQKNLLGVFAFNSFHKSLVTNNHSLIVFDDVWTTGATLREAGKVLKRNGAKSVWGLTIAR